MMRTGIKTLVKTTLRKLWQLPEYHPGRFPESGKPAHTILARLAETMWDLRDRHVAYNLGSLYTMPYGASTVAYRALIGFNPAQLGSVEKASEDVIQRYEYEVIQKMIHLYHGAPDSLTGYMTSGGTEGNLFSYWLGSASLRRIYAQKDICLLVTPLTHYSVKKAAAIGGMETHAVRLDQESWSMSEPGFVQMVRALYKKGYRGFMACLTVGYSATGSIDDVGRITQAARKLKRELSGISFFFWVDAALNGLIVPFSGGTFAPFSNSDVSAVVTDFHKFSLAPYPAGLVLYRKALGRHIASDIDYLPQRDTTVSGSRSGVSAVAVWAAMHALGADGLRNIVRKQREHKALVLSKLAVPSIQTVTHPDSLTVGLMFPTLPGGRLPVWIEEKYWLYGGQTKSYGMKGVPPRMYKVFFLPHMTGSVVRMFIKDISSAVGEQ